MSKIGAASVKSDSGAPLLSALASCAAVLAWLQFFFLAPLKDEASDHHERQLDPTEIVAIPYDLQRLGLYVMGTAFVGIFAATYEDNEEETSGSWWRRILELIGLSAVVFVAMILCGASPSENLAHTGFAAVHLTTMAAFLDPPVFKGNRSAGAASGAAVPPKGSQSRGRRLLQRLGGGQLNSKRDRSDAVASVATNATVALTIPFQILLLYDRGWQAQRWPVPVVLGSTIGWVLGTVSGTILQMIYSSAVGNIRQKGEAKLSSTATGGEGSSGIRGAHDD